MRSWLALVMLAGSAHAQDVNDKLVLDVAKQAGFVDAEIVARGAVTVVVDHPKVDPTGMDDVDLAMHAPRFRIAVAVPGKTFVELAKTDGPTTAKIGAFLDRKDIIDIDLGHEDRAEALHVSRHRAPKPADAADGPLVDRRPRLRAALVGHVHEEVITSGR